MIKTNAHTHLELSGLKDLCPVTPLPFIQWVMALTQAMNHIDLSAIIEKMSESIDYLEKTNTSHICDISSIGLSIQPLFNSNLRGIVFLEILSLDSRDAYIKFEQIKVKIKKFQKHHNWGKMIIGISIHSPFTCPPDVISGITKWTNENKIPICIHISESKDEQNLFLMKPSGFKEYFLNLKIINKTTPIQFMESIHALSKNVFLVHCVHLNDKDISIIKKRGCSVIHCPRSNYLLNNNRMKIDKILSNNIPLFLGTDSLASSPSLDINDEVDFCYDYHDKKISKEILMGLITKPIDFSFN